MEQKIGSEKGKQIWNIYSKGQFPELVTFDVSLTHVLEYEMWINMSYGHWNVFFQKSILASKRIL